MSELQGPKDPTGGGDGVEMPLPTVWPIVLALGIALMATGPVLSWAMTVVGAVLALIAGYGWIGQLLPGKGHGVEKRATARPRPVRSSPGTVKALREGMPGHRMRLPEKIHPYSAGVRGGLVGGLVMLVPAVLYGLLYHNSFWYPVNLLAGMVLPSFADMPDEQLRQFSLLALMLGLVIHAVISVGLGLLYGVLLPTLPGPSILWGGVVMPLLWTGAIYGFMGVLNPRMHEKFDWNDEWPWFIASQFVYGIVAGIVVLLSEKVYVDRPRPAQAETAEYDIDSPAGEACEDAP